MCSILPLLAAFTTASPQKSTTEPWLTHTTVPFTTNVSAHNSTCGTTNGEGCHNLGGGRPYQRLSAHLGLASGTALANRNQTLVLVSTHAVYSGWHHLTESRPPLQIRFGPSTVTRRYLPDVLCTPCRVEFCCAFSMKGSCKSFLLHRASYCLRDTVPVVHRSHSNDCSRVQ